MWLTLCTPVAEWRELGIRGYRALLPVSFVVSHIFCNSPSSPSPPALMHMPYTPANAHPTAPILSPDEFPDILRVPLVWAAVIVGFFDAGAAAIFLSAPSHTDSPLICSVLAAYTCTDARTKKWSRHCCRHSTH